MKCDRKVGSAKEERGVNVTLGKAGMDFMEWILLAKNGQNSLVDAIS